MLIEKATKRMIKKTNMNIVELKELISVFSSHCPEKGLKRDGYNLRLNHLNNVAVINFQKSKDNIPNGYKFTINIGVHYGKLFFFNSCQSIKKPIINDCQWKIRIGFLLPFKSDYWWSVDTKTDIEKLKANLFEIFNTVINPTLENLISDEGYTACLIANKAAGTSEFDRLKNLASIFCINKDTRLNEVLIQLKAYCIANKLSTLYEKKIKQINIWKLKPEHSIWSFDGDFYTWV